MNSALKWVGCALTSLAIFGCNPNPLSIEMATVRVALTDQGNGNSICQIWSEGTDGNLVTGSKIQIISPSESVSLLSFDQDEGCYYSTLASEEGVWRVAVESKKYLNPDIFLFFKLLSEKANINNCYDNAGGDAFNGDPLSGSAKISIAWNAVTGATVYVVTLSRNGILKQKFSVDDSFYSFPNNLEAGSYVVSITSQAISGDLLYIDYNWCSVSETTGSSFGFTVQ